MNAQDSDIKRMQEIVNVIQQTQQQIEEIGMNKTRFVNPCDAAEELIVEGLENRVFRVAEEGGRMSEAAEAFGFERKTMSGLRNILAHAYGQVDHEIVWNVIEKDFPALLKACEAYCESLGFDIT